jgi:hypothetical protein
MKKLFITALILTLSLAVVASAEWKVLDNGAALKALNSNDIKVEITIPPYKQEMVTINGKECVVIHMPEASMYMKRGFPMVPKLTKLIKIADRCNVKLEVLSKEEVEVPLTAPIVPSKGHFTREIPYDSVPFDFGPIYREDVFWPSEKEQFQVGEPFDFRDVHGVRVQILPIRANHVTMKMKVLTKVVFVLICEDNGRMSAVRQAVRPGKTFRSMYQESFLNATDTTTSERGTVPNENNKKLVVVTPNQYEGMINGWVNWKKQSGYEVTVKSYATVSASTVKADLQALYDNVATRFGYVVLVGDADKMPTFKGTFESADADRVYVRLAGNDNYPDAFISRISGDATSIPAQFAKIIAYEQSPEAGDWLNKGICIASDQGSPTDKARAEWIQNGGGAGQKVPVDAGGLIGYGYTYFDDIYDPSASATMVTNAVNNGRGIICYIGHGSSTSWGTTGFSVSNVNGLNNGNKFPVIFSVACVNGDFVRTGTCFAEGWLRKAGGGAVAFEGASTNEAWVPPCDKQCATVNAIIRKTNFTFGALEAVGCVKGLEAWGDTNSGQGNQMAEQCNLFGDCTLLVRTKAAATMSAQATRGLDNNLTFQVATENRAEVNGTVTIYTQDMSFVVTGETDDNGSVNLSLVDCPANAQLFYTVVAPDTIPLIDQPIN